jgi:hypothetical protein
MKEQDLLSKLMSEEELEPGTSSEWTIEESGETNTNFIKKATAVKAKPAPKSMESQEPDLVYEINEESETISHTSKKTTVGKTRPAPKQ